VTLFDHAVLFEEHTRNEFVIVTQPRSETIMGCTWGGRPTVTENYRDQVNYIQIPQHPTYPSSVNVDMEDFFVHLIENFIHDNRFVDRDFVREQVWCIEKSVTEFFVKTPFIISGVTRDANGASIGGCTVWLHRADGKSLPLQTTTSNESGEYFFYVRDAVTEYFVLAFKTGDPDIFGVTEKTLKGVAV